MRFSVLLPTRNGGPLLETCVRSVLDQGWDDLELVVADNANTDETPSVLERHSRDQRLTVVRAEQPLSVTDNWNAALERSTGEYLILLNDDALLLPGYFEHAEALLRRHGEPDCMTCASCFYIFPDASLGQRLSHFRDPAYPQEGVGTERMVSASERRQRVSQMFGDFGLAHCFPSMQRTLVARRAIDRLTNGLFRPPFPDVYALAALCLTAASWLLTPERLLVTGASRDSFWHLHFSGRRAEGARYLGNRDLAEPLPGDETLNAMVAVQAALKADYPEQLEGITSNDTLYAARQVWAWLRARRGGAISGRELAGRLAALAPRDLARLGAAPFQKQSRRAARLALEAHARNRTMTESEAFSPLAGVEEIGAFGEWLRTREARPPSA